MTTEEKIAVKALEWTSEPPYSVARVSRLFLLYSTECVWDDGKFLYCQLSGNCLNGTFASLAEARAAAQSDYETRIRSALAPSDAMPVATMNPCPECGSRWEDARGHEPTCSRYPHDWSGLAHPAPSVPPPLPQINGLPIAIAIGSEVRRLNRVGGPETKGAISASCELAATEIVLQALASHGYTICPPLPGEVGETVAKLLRVGSEVLSIPINPDGPEAASLLTAQAAELERMKASGRTAIDAGEVMIATLTAERDEALAKIHDNRLIADEAYARAEAAEAALAAAKAEVERYRNGLKAARAPIAQLIAAEYNVESWGLKQRLAAIDAALLEPSGEPK